MPADVLILVKIKTVANGEGWKTAVASGTQETWEEAGGEAAFKIWKLWITNIQVRSLWLYLYASDPRLQS